MITITPWQAAFGNIYYIDRGGPRATGFAEMVCRLHRSAGIVRVGGTRPDWLLPIVEQSGLSRCVVLTNGVMRPFSTPLAKMAGPPLANLTRFKAAKAKMMESFDATLRTWRPDVVVCDLEHATRNLQDLPEELANIVNDILGSWTPIYHCGGRAHYGQGDALYGSGPCPTFYQIWLAGDPLEKLRELMARENSAVKDGYPWLCPFAEVERKDTLVPMRTWVRAWHALRQAGAKGGSMWPSPWSSCVGTLDNPVHLQLVEMMNAAARVFQASADGHIMMPREMRP